MATPLHNLNHQNPAAFTNVLSHLKSNPNKIEEYLISNWKDFPPKNVNDIEDLLHFCLCIIAGGMEPEQYFGDLQKQGILTSSVCGFVWKGGDTAYKCKTCQIDSSCALCTTCFQAGSHEGHDYSLQKIGGGFCDCGDPHSWKATAFCPNHKPVEGSILGQANKLPPYLVTATHAVFRAVLVRLEDTLSSGTLYADDKEPTSIISWLDSTLRFGDFFRAILIQEIIKADNPNGEKFPGKGESLLARFTAVDNVNIPPPLAIELHTLYFHLLIIPEFKRPFLSTHFLPHYEKNIDEYAKGFRERDMFGDFTVQLFTAPPLVDILIEHKTFELILDKLYNMFAKALVDRKRAPRVPRKKAQEKLEGAESTAKSEEKKDEKEAKPVEETQRKGKRKKDEIQASETTQEPPAPPATPHVAPNPVPQYSKVLSTRKPVTYQRLYVSFTTDLGYILVHQIIPQRMFDDPSLATLDMWLAVVGLIQGMGGNTVTLKTHYDPEQWICSYLTEMDILSTLPPLLTNSPKSSLPQMERIVSRISRSLGGWLLGWGVDQQHDNGLFFGIMSQILKGEIPQIGITEEGSKPYVETVSYHLPLHRVLASFLNESLPLFAGNNNNNSNNNNNTAQGIEGLLLRVSQLGTDVTAKQLAGYTLYHPLRLAALSAQIRAGLWRSGGGEEEVWGQDVMYHSVHFQKYYDLDIFLIQVCAALLGSNEFHLLAAQMFGVLSYLRLDNRPKSNAPPSTPAPSTPAPTGAVPQTPSTPSTSTAAPSTPAPTITTVPQTPFTPAPTAEPTKEEAVSTVAYGFGFPATDDQNKVLSEDLLHFLITTARERMLSGMTDAQKIRREIIHRLVLGDITHSQLVGNIQKGLVEHPEFEDILKEVAIFHKPQKMEQGKYHMKDECWAEYDPYFPHYTRQELQAAEEFAHEFRTKTPRTPTTPGGHGATPSKALSSSSSSTRSSSAPNLPNAPFAALSTVSNLIHSRFLHQIIFTILFNASKSSTMVSDAMLTHVFYLIELILLCGPPDTDKDFIGSSTSSQSSGLAINIDFPSANNFIRNAGYDYAVEAPLKTSIVNLLVTLQYLPSTPAEQKDIISRILRKMADAAPLLRDQIEVCTSQYVFASKGKKDKEDEEEKKRKAKARQAAILQQMKSRQSIFEQSLLMADEDDMDDLEDTSRSTAIPTNTTSDGEVVTSTCALCREGGNLTTRPLGHVAFVQRSVVLALAKWAPDVRRARIESTQVTHVHPAPGSEHPPGTPATTMDVADAAPSSPHRAARLMFGDDDMEFEEEYDDEDESSFPGGEGEDDDDETARALRFMYNLAHGYYAGDPEQQGMAPAPEMPQHFPQFHPQSDEGDEGGTDESGDEEESLFDSEDELEIDDDEEDDEDADDDENEPGPWDSDDDNQLDQIMQDIVDDLGGGVVPGEDLDEMPSLEDDDDDDVEEYENMDDDDIQLVVVDKKDEKKVEEEQKPDEAKQEEKGKEAAASGPAPEPALENGDWVPIPGMDGRMQVVARDGDHYEVRLRMDPNWLAAHGHPPDQAGALEVKLDDDDDKSKQLDLWANPEATVGKTNKVALGRPFTASETFRDLEGSVGTHLTFCGHVIHHDCFNNYFSALIRSHFQDNAYEGEDLIVLEKGEFLCPLCRRIGNCLIPIVPDSSFEFPKPSPHVSIGADLDPILQGLHDPLNPSPTTNSTPAAPTPPNNFDTAVEQVANRVYCVQHNVGFESLSTDINTGPNLVAALASAVACTELAQRSNEANALVANPGQRVDLRALYRTCITRLSAHPLPQHDSRCTWAMLCGSPVPAPTSTPTTTTPASNNTNNSTTTTTTTQPTTPSQPLNFPPLLATDLFHVVVQVSIHTPFDTSKFMDIVRIMFDAVILQILLHYKISYVVPEAVTHPFVSDNVYPAVSPPVPAPPKDTFHSLVVGYLDAASASTTPSSSPSFIPVPAVHADRIKALSLPFLRRCALFLHTCLYSTHPPADKIDQYDNLSEYLQLPKLETVIDGLLRHQNSLASKWLSQYASAVHLIDETLPQHLLAAATPSPALPPSLLAYHAPAQPFRLISLPTSYQSVYQYCTTTPCRSCGQISNMPGLCLVCGCIVCLGTPCCRDDSDRGEGSVHSATCSVATPYLVAKSTAILLLRGERHAFWGSPYLDEHGEEDSHLRRGKPLFLNPSRYDQLSHMVAACQLESDSKVIESSSLVDAEYY